MDINDITEENLTDVKLEEMRTERENLYEKWSSKDGTDEDKKALDKIDRLLLIKVKQARSEKTSKHVVS